jgi:hypothetical protein
VKCRPFGAAFLLFDDYAKVFHHTIREGADPASYVGAYVETGAGPVNRHGLPAHPSHSLNVHVPGDKHERPANTEAPIIQPAKELN